MQHKNPAWFQIHAGFYCEPEGLSPDGGLYYTSNMELYQTGEPRGLLPSGGKTPAKLHVCRASSAPYGRDVGSRGTAPCASHEACRPTAVFSIQQTRKTHQTGEPRGPLPSGGNSAAKSHVLRVLPRPMGAEWGAGGHPLRAVRKGAQPPWMSTGRSVSWKGSVSPLRS